MKLNRGFVPVLWLLVAILMISTAVAQETTAGLQGTVKDPQGLVVAKATVEVSGPALIGVKKAETDNSGYYRFANLPPGTYIITVSAQGFRTLKQSGLNLEVGKLPTVDLKLEIGGVEQTVEVTSAAPIVDVTQSKVAVTVGEEVINGIPKGRSFQSVIQFAPGARYEPLQSDGGVNGTAGYQINGASNSENSYLVEGQETSDVITGQTRTSAPFEFIQEVQVKSSGFEAEYGGALGGVVNVIQKRGGNAWHGSVFSYSAGSPFNAAPSQILRDDGVLIQPKKDKYRTIEPGFEAGGYLWKDRIWSFSSFVPSYNSRSRTVDYGGATGLRTFSQNNNTYFGLQRLDALVTNKIRVFGSMQYGYNRVYGSLLPDADDVFGAENLLSGVDSYNYGIGYVQPNVIYNTGADITLTPNIVATTRFGYFYDNYEDRGRARGMRYRWLDPNYPYATGIGAATAGTEALDGTLLGDAYPSAIHTYLYSSMGANAWTLFDQTSRKSFSQDIAWFKRGFLGTHNIKGGYAFNKLANQVNNGYQTAQAYLGYGVDYWTVPNSVLPDPSNGGALAPACKVINDYNNANFGANIDPASENYNSACRGNWGTVNFREVGTVGVASSTNHALYVQDAWTVGKGITLNVGVRFDREALPSYAAGLPGISFGFGDKVAPRLGGSWDVLQNGKFKIYGSFGYFYDIMKYSLPRGAFGGDYWHDCVYAMDDPNYSHYNPVQVNGHFCNPTGGANFQGGTTPAGLRFIENYDYRVVSNLQGAESKIDPNLKPMKQHEMVLGTDWAISPKLGFEARWSRKRLDRTIEDAGRWVSGGEEFFIVNPGEGIHQYGGVESICTGCVRIPKAIRDYDGVEFRLTRKATERWFGTVSYTWSRLTGNYPGLTSTDASDAVGRADANVSRAFDEPYMMFDAKGHIINDVLPTDRPHTLKAFGWYRLKYFKQESLIGLTQQWYSGTPLTTYVDVAGAYVFPENRGSYQVMNQDGTFGAVTRRRTEAFSQTDFNFVHDFKVSKTNEALKLGFEANILNIFNQKHELNEDQLLNDSGSIVQRIGDPPVLDYKTFETGYDWKAMAIANELTLNPKYGRTNMWQTGRTMRFKIKFSF